MNKERQGLVIVHTGNGKGKTTAALGLAVRAWGQGLKILILQFIKGSWKYGELKALEKFEPNLMIEQAGEGFVKQAEGEEKSKHIEVAKHTFLRAKKEAVSDKWDMIILDELNYAVKFGLIEKEAVLELVKIKPANLHLVITGRDAVPELIAMADLVTEMKEVKHPYKKGIKAQRGVEF